MLGLSFTSKFKRDYKRIKKQGKETSQSSKSSWRLS